jgi:cyanophycinase-like exopeptidase
VIDQHFTQRNRQERLLEALRMVEGAGGIGIDENTALVIRGGETAEVIGIGNVYIYFLNQEKPLILHPGETINFSTGKVVQGKKDNLIEDVQEVRKAN